jgi:hypothetical protein
MGQAGRTRCLHQFDINTTVEQIETIYQQGLRQLRRGR